MKKIFLAIIGLISISVITLQQADADEIALSDRSGRSISSVTVIPPTNGSDDRLYNYEEVLLSGIGDDVKAKFQGDDLSDTTDYSVDQPISSYGTAFLIKNPYQFVEIEGSFDENGWMTEEDCENQALYGIETVVSKDQNAVFINDPNADNSHYITYNNFAVISDGKNYKYLDITIIPHVIPDEEATVERLGIGFGYLPDGTSSDLGESIYLWQGEENIVLDIEVRYSDGYLKDDTNNKQDEGEELVSFGYPTEGNMVSGGLNLYLTDLDFLQYYAIDAADVNTVRMPYCSLEDIPSTADGSSIDLTNPCWEENLEYRLYRNSDGTWPHIDSTMTTYVKYAADHLGISDLEYNRLKVYFDHPSGGDKIVILDSWAAAEENLLAQSFQLETKTGNFQLETGFQNTWWGYPHKIVAGSEFISTKAAIPLINKQQYDAGIGYNSEIPEYGVGVNDGTAAPDETILYTLVLENVGYETDDDFELTDTIPLEYNNLDFSKVQAVKIPLEQYEAFSEASDIAALAEICSTGEMTCTELEEGTDYTVDSSDAREMVIRFNATLESQTTYLFQFELKVNNKFNYEVDKEIVNNVTLCNLNSSDCTKSPNVKINYSDIALKITKSVDDKLDNSFTPTSGFGPNNDGYASDGEWVNYTITITNNKSDGALGPVEDVHVVDTINTDQNLERIDPTTLEVSSNTNEDISDDIEDYTTSQKLGIVIPIIDVNETITITFKAKVKFES